MPIRHKAPIIQEVSFMPFLRQCPEQPQKNHCLHVHYRGLVLSVPPWNHITHTCVCMEQICVMRRDQEILSLKSYGQWVVGQIQPVTCFCKYSFIETQILILLPIVYSIFYISMAEVSICDRNHVAHNV